jgi:hypothetical protein
MPFFALLIMTMAYLGIPEHPVSHNSLVPPAADTAILDLTFMPTCLGPSVPEFLFILHHGTHAPVMPTKIFIVHAA